MKPSGCFKILSFFHDSNLGKGRGGIQVFFFFFLGWMDGWIDSPHVWWLQLPPPFSHSLPGWEAENRWPHPADRWDAHSGSGQWPGGAGAAGLWYPCADADRTRPTGGSPASTSTCPRHSSHHLSATSTSCASPQEQQNGTEYTSFRMNQWMVMMML